VVRYCGGLVWLAALVLAGAALTNAAALWRLPGALH
jgi:hypothetical protein